MPREGIFGVVIRGGTIKVGDEIEVLPTRSSSAAIIGSREAERQFGEQLKEIVMRKWQPGFVRFDNLNSAENNLQEILADLMGTQRADHILLFDPSGRHALALAGKSTGESSHISYCRSIEEVEGLEK